MMPMRLQSAAPAATIASTLALMSRTDPFTQRAPLSRLTECSSRSPTGAAHVGARRPPRCRGRAAPGTFGAERTGAPALPGRREARTQRPRGRAAVATASFKSVVRRKAAPARRAPRAPPRLCVNCRNSPEARSSSQISAGTWLRAAHGQQPAVARKVEADHEIDRQRRFGRYCAGREIDESEFTPARTSHRPAPPLAAIFRDLERRQFGVVAAGRTPSARVGRRQGAPRAKAIIDVGLTQDRYRAAVGRKRPLPKLPGRCGVSSDSAPCSTSTSKRLLLPRLRIRSRIASRRSRDCFERADSFRSARPTGVRRSRRRPGRRPMPSGRAG